MARPPSRSPGRGGARGAAGPRQSTPFLVLQFFIFPLSIVAVCVAVFVVFGMIASEGKGAREHLADVRTGGANRRWQAAFELAKVLQAGKDPALKDPAFTAEVAKVFDEAAGDDPRVRRYLALALGRIGDRRAVPALLKAVDDAGADGSRADPETQVYAVWALGVIGDPQAVPRLVALARSDDPGLRKAAVHALGAFPQRGGARGAGHRALRSRRPTCAGTRPSRWPAAAIPRRCRCCSRMMDRARAGRACPASPTSSASEAMVQAVEAAAVVHDARLDEADPRDCATAIPTSRSARPRRRRSRDEIASPHP